MKSTSTSLLCLTLSWATVAPAATLYLGDGATADISGAFNSGVQDWNTTAANWTPTLNPTAYTTFTAGDDAIFLGDLPALTVTEDISVNNISRQTQVDANANRIDFNVSSNVTLTINGFLNNRLSGLDTSPRQVNVNGPGNLGGEFEIADGNRIRLQQGINAAPGAVLTSTNGTQVWFIDTVGDMSGLTLNIRGTVVQFNGEAMTLGALSGNGTLAGSASAVTNLSVRPGSAEDGTGIGAITDDSFGNTLVLGGTIAVSGGTITNYTGELYLGDGATTLTNSPATWDTTSPLWALGPDPAFSAWTNWIDGSDAIFKGIGTTHRIVELATNLSVTINGLIWDTPGQGLVITGDVARSQTLIITNEARTAMGLTPRQISMQNLKLGGSFDVLNVSRFVFGEDAEVLPDTAIRSETEIQFNGTSTIRPPPGRP